MKTALKTLICLGCAALLLPSCAKMIEETKTDESSKLITATVILPDESAAKVLYAEYDPTNKNNGLNSLWEEGDQIQAIANTGERVTLNLVEGAGTTVGKFVAEASWVTSSTQWQAVLGKKVSDEGSAIICSYDGQDGTIENIGDYDFISTTGTGDHPVFNFSSIGTRYSYFLRLKLPAGIKSIEYCSDAYWSITKSAATAMFYDNFDNVSEIVLPSASTAGQIVYVAVPATAHHDYITNAQKGIIFTFFNSDKTKSYGKVLSANLSERPGKITTMDITSMTLIDRVLPSDALDFGTVAVTMEKDELVNSYNNLDDYQHTAAISTKWSPYNLGSNFSSPANRGQYVGDCFAWGEIAPKTDFTNSGYGYDGNHTVGGLENFPNTHIGKMHTYQVSGPSGSGTMKLQQIAGTKYDAARVLWGSDWRMPTIEDLMMFTGSSLSKDYGETGTVATTESGFTTKNENVSVPGGLTMEGRWFEKNSVRIFFPSAGWKKKATWGDTQYFYSRGLYWSDSRIRATPSNGALTNQPVSMEFQRNGLLMYGKDPDGGLAKEMYCGLYIRPVINNHNSSESYSISPTLIEDGVDVPTVYPSSTLYGYVKDNSNNPIAGVVVSDGYSCCTTDRFGLYQMKANADARFVTVTVPAAYEIPAAFYQVLGAKVDGKWADKNFTLTPRAGGAATRATIVALTDAHVKDATTQTRFNSALLDVNTTINTLKSTGIPVGTPANAPAGDVVCISLGDQMWDSMAKASDIKTAFSTLNAPVLYTIGNHDHDNSQSTASASENAFINTFAPTNYSIDIANVHIMFLDDVYFTGNGSETISFNDGFTQAQVNWLKADIAKVQNASNKIGVLCVHVPLAKASAGDSGTQDAVMSALKNNFKNVHVFSGHDHNLHNNLYHGWNALSGRQIYEHTLQAFCGYWWESDVSYIAGCSAGYGVFTFDQNDIYAEYNKITKMPASFQMRVYDGSATYNKNSAWDEMMHGGARGYKEYTWDSPVKNKYVVRLNDPGSTNDSSDYWTVSVNGSTMTRVETSIKDACVASYVFNNIKGTHGDANGVMDHLWYSSANFNSSFTVTATHTMPSGWSATFTSTHYVGTNYKGFAYGETFD